MKIKIILLLKKKINHEKKNKNINNNNKKNYTNNNFNESDLKIEKNEEKEYNKELIIHNNINEI